MSPLLFSPPTSTSHIQTNKKGDSSKVVLGFKMDVSFFPQNGWSRKLRFKGRFWATPKKTHEQDMGLSVFGAGTPALLVLKEN